MAPQTFSLLLIHFLVTNCFYSIDTRKRRWETSFLLTMSLCDDGDGGGDPCHRLRLLLRCHREVRESLKTFRSYFELTSTKLL